MKCGAVVEVTEFANAVTTSDVFPSGHGIAPIDFLNDSRRLACNQVSFAAARQNMFGSHRWSILCEAIEIAELEGYCLIISA